MTVNRRDFLAGTGLTLTTALAGCANQSNPPRQDTQTPNNAQPKDPIPATAEVSYLSDLTNDTLTIHFNTLKTPREATFHLYVQRPDPGTSLTWRMVEYLDPTGNETLKRPVLDLPIDDREHISSVKHKKDSGGYGDRIEFSHEKQPADTPLQYVVEVEEHTLDGQSQVLGTTTLAYRPPESDTYNIQPVNADTVRPFDMRVNGKDTADGTRTRRVTGTTSPSRYNVLRVETAKNRPLELGRTDYKTGMYELPWSVTFDIATADYESAMETNIIDYDGPVDGYTNQMDNVHRIYLYYLNENPVLDDLARQLNNQAEEHGFVTSMQKLRFMCDLIQWMPYTDDTEVPSDKPKVKHPVTTLYEWTGDCEDKVAALAGLLHQDAFPDYDIATFYVTSTGGASAPAHHGLAISTDSFNTNISTLNAGQNGYIYVDATYPAPIDYVPEKWTTPELTVVRPRGDPSPFDE